MYSVKLIKENRKSPILNPPAFGCLKGMPSINITRGCLHSCVYCYARGFRDAPPKGEIHLYENLPEMLKRELDRKRKPPPWVSFSTASDAFQDMDEVLQITYKTMDILFERAIGISFLTKGFIPSGFIKLFGKYPHLVKARIGIVSLNEDYRRLFEPYSAHPIKRLKNIKNLIDIGIDVSVRIDPIIPVVSDSEDSFEHLIKRLKATGVKDISISFLVMRSSIMNQFVKELPFRVAKGILEYYNGQPYQRVITSAKTRLLPEAIRISQYEGIKKIAKRYGIKCIICGCKNPDLPWEFCNPWPSNPSYRSELQRQGVLFPQGAEGQNHLQSI